MLEIILTEEAQRLQAKYPEISFIPKKMTEKACGYDVRYCGEKDIVLSPQEEFKIPTGFHTKLKGLEEKPNNIKLGLFILPRSSINGFMLTNTLGLGDLEEYEGQYFVKVFNRTDEVKVIKAFERIAQVVIVPTFDMDFIVVDSFTENSSRGSGGFGSTGKI
jgi:dUTP pyrophosphatase